MASSASLRWLRQFAVAVLLLAPLRGQIVTNLGDIEWGNPAGWSSGRVPTATDTPQISSRTVTVTGKIAVASLLLQGGALSSTGTSTLAVPFTNTGPVVVTSGTLALTSTFSNSGGGLMLNNGPALAVRHPPPPHPSLKAEHGSSENFGRVRHRAGHRGER